LLNGLRLLRQTAVPDAGILEQQIADLLQQAHSQGNLFVTLMAGGVLSRRLLGRGQLRRSEKIARQVLEQALAQRGKLPEPASIALAALGQVHLERNELGLAQKYLDQALEVDPNPTSTNMLVQIAFQRAEIQMAQGNFSEALADIQSIHELHLRRPSGVWTDQDLRAYEAMIHTREGNVASAEESLDASGEAEEHGLSKLVRAEILLLRPHAEAAEELLGDIISQYPHGILSMPLLRARLLFARALFDQHKTNQALQAMKDAIRLAAPEQWVRPFLETNTRSMPLLTLALQTESLTPEARTFIKGLLRLSDSGGGDAQISQAEIDSLSTAASISPREQEVLRLMCAGYSNREMAGKLSVSESTIKTHVGNIYLKLHVNSRVQAILSAKELKLVE
jgi:LuxR family maltose regulon positive regulatory protein